MRDARACEHRVPFLEVKRAYAIAKAINTPHAAADERARAVLFGQCAATIW